LDGLTGFFIAVTLNMRKANSYPSKYEKSKFLSLNKENQSRIKEVRLSSIKKKDIKTYEKEWPSI